MTFPRVMEIPPRLEPVCADPFIQTLPAGEADATSTATPRRPTASARR
jgi:hypothetical protein